MSLNKKYSSNTRNLLIKLAKMDRLPIALDPSTWEPQQLMEIFQTPNLLKLLRNDSQTVTRKGKEISRYEAAIEELKNAGVTFKDIMDKSNPEDWPESGWFLLVAGSEFLGFVNGEANAKFALDNWVEKASKNSTVLRILHSIFDKTFERITEKVIPETHDQGEFIRNQVMKRLRELDSHPMYSKKRKELLESITSIVKAPNGLIPSPDSKISGMPTTDTSESAEYDLRNFGDDNYSEKGFKNESIKSFYKDLKNKEKNKDDILEDWSRKIAEPITKKIRYIVEKEKEGIKIDPENMADDYKIARFNMKYSSNTRNLLNKLAQEGPVDNIDTDSYKMPYKNIAQDPYLIKELKEIIGRFEVEFSEMKKNYINFGRDRRMELFRSIDKMRHLLEMPFELAPPKYSSKIVNLLNKLAAKPELSDRINSIVFNAKLLSDKLDRIHPSSKQDWLDKLSEVESLLKYLVWSPKGEIF